MSRTFRDRGKLTHKSRENFLKECSGRLILYHNVQQMYIAWDIKNYNRIIRDGYWNDTGRKSAFKYACTKEIRVKNRQLLHRVKVGKVDVDTTLFPDRKNGKARVWDFW